MIAALSLDPRVIGEITAKKEGAEPPVHALAVTSDGYALRFSLEPFVEPSTRAGRRYARAGRRRRGGDASRVTTGEEVVIAATADARALLCKADEVNFLSGPGRGVILIKVKFPDDKVIGAHRLDRRSRSDDGGNEPRRRADDQHREVRGDGARRQGPRAAAARPVRAGVARGRRRAVVGDVG